MGREPPRPRAKFQLGAEARAKHTAEIARRIVACNKSSSSAALGAADRPITLDMVDSALFPDEPETVAQRLVERLEDHAATGSIYSINYRQLLRSMDQVKAWPSVPFLPDFVADDGTLCVTRIRAQMMAGVDEPPPKKRKEEVGEDGATGAAETAAVAQMPPKMPAPSAAAASSATNKQEKGRGDTPAEPRDKKTSGGGSTTTAAPSTSNGGAAEPAVGYFFLSGAASAAQPTRPTTVAAAAAATAAAQPTPDADRRTAIADTEALLHLLDTKGPSKAKHDAAAEAAQAPQHHVPRASGPALGKAEAAEVREGRETRRGAGWHGWQTRGAAASPPNAKF